MSCKTWVIFLYEICSGTATEVLVPACCSFSLPTPAFFFSHPTKPPCIPGISGGANPTTPGQWADAENEFPTISSPALLIEAKALSSYITLIFSYKRAYLRWTFEAAPILFLSSSFPIPSFLISTFSKELVSRAIFYKFIFFFTRSTSSNSIAHFWVSATFRPTISPAFSFANYVYVSFY